MTSKIITILGLVAISICLWMFTMTSINKQEDEEVTPKKIADNLINKHKVVIFSKSYCPHSTMTKETFKKYPNIDLKIYELDRDIKNGEEIQNYLGTLCRKTIEINNEKACTL
ncbi:hypothetical protein GJ496_007352 [Pomphorhynchus laevis]|nr:hypothetical protein GJ496_007352 [Pomphorhynchus laevis]